MVSGFYEKRPYLDEEFEHPHWNELSGQDAPTLSGNLKKFIDGHLHLPMPILRAKVYEWLLANAQIEINPHSIFADKIDIGVDFSSTHAGGDIFAKNVFYRFNEEILDREIPVEHRRNKQATRLGIGTAWADYWHTLPDWNEVFRLGFPGLLHRAEQIKSDKASAEELTPEQEIFTTPSSLAIGRYYIISAVYMRSR